ncbi:hypothetical protein SY87_20155 [Burkholderia pseudomallei]|nr:hypothetical protein BGI47_08890 [Burkholderia pseudomallei]APZ24946.1 hypothetical protein BGI46_08885 [Burkholderia pseudomallei]KIX44383.1 hypothetical protein SY87_20155 [Burkholderia pseudomallei]OMR89401.1 hypothetical protein AQ732_06140 [Burkholderia pseudomallei]OMZ41214.1 hypothetical protein AQ862_30845 [Burkholderia pseudomallei]
MEVFMTSLDKGQAASLAFAREQGGSVFELNDLRECLDDIDAVAAAINEVSAFAKPNERGVCQLASVLHVLSAYLAIRTGYLRNTVAG